jgi:hypothetical protein
MRRDGIEPEHPLDRVPNVSRHANALVVRIVPLAWSLEVLEVHAEGSGELFGGAGEDDIMAGRRDFDDRERLPTGEPAHETDPVVARVVVRSEVVA